MPVATTTTTERDDDDVDDKTSFYIRIHCNTGCPTGTCAE